MVQEVLGGLPWGDIGPVGLLAIVVLMVLTGRLVPRSTLENERENCKAWRTSSETQQTINSELKGGITEMLHLARSSDHALRSIQSMGAAVFQAQLTREESQG